jgi:hypothetical protein
LLLDIFEIATRRFAAYRIHTFVMISNGLIISFGRHYAYTEDGDVKSENSIHADCGHVFKQEPID